MNNGRNKCFFISSTAQDGTTAKQVCNLAQPGWKRFFGKLFGVGDTEFDIICICENDDCINNGVGRLTERKITAAEVACEAENLLKITKIVVYKGEPINLIITVCA